jgi:hypothetical protein
MAILSLASHNFSSHVHGQIINVDGGKQGKVMWTKEELAWNQAEDEFQQSGWSSRPHVRTSTTGSATLSTSQAYRAGGK